MKKIILLLLLFVSNLQFVYSQTYCVTLGTPNITGTTVTIDVTVSVSSGKLASSTVDLNFDAAKLAYSSATFSSYPNTTLSVTNNSPRATINIAVPASTTPITSVTGTLTFTKTNLGSSLFSVGFTEIYECTSASTCTTTNKVTTSGGAPCGTTASLPISLTTFQAAPLPTAIALDWGSTNELNFSGFEVERGMDGKSFEKIAWVAAKGGVSVAEYKHLDQTAQRGMTYYYRLKMVDNDGIFKYSPVRTARLGEGTINAFPNPSGGQYTIALERTRSAEGTVTVTDVMGKTVKMERRTLDAALTLDLNALPDGVYHVKIDDGTAAQTVRVVKQ